MTAEEKEQLERDWQRFGPAINNGFPKLKSTKHQVTSPRNPQYNCIAWAAHTTNCWWWPARDAFWPPGAPMTDNISSFHAAYNTLGFIPIEEAEIPNYREIIALMGNGTTVKHAMRLLPDGMWSSKLGKLFDISHEINSLEGHEYGVVIGFMGKDHK